MLQISFRAFVLVSIVLTLFSYLILQWVEEVEPTLILKNLGVAIVSINLGVFLGFLLSYLDLKVSATAAAAVPTAISLFETSFQVFIPFWLKAWVTNSFMVFLAIFSGYVFSLVYLKVSSDYERSSSRFRIDRWVAGWFKDLSGRGPRERDVLTLLVLAPFLILVGPFIRTGIFFFNHGVSSFIILPLLIFEGFLAIYSCSVGMGIEYEEGFSIGSRHLIKFVVLVGILLVAAGFEELLISLF